MHVYLPPFTHASYAVFDYALCLTPYKYPVIEVILSLCRPWRHILAAEAYFESFLNSTLDWDEGSSSQQGRFPPVNNTEWDVENIKIIIGKYVYDAAVDSTMLRAAWPVFTTDKIKGLIQLRVIWVQSALPLGSSFRSARWPRTSINASKRMRGTSFPPFHMSP